VVVIPMMRSHLPSLDGRKIIATHLRLVMAVAPAVVVGIVLNLVMGNVDADSSLAKMLAAFGHICVVAAVMSLVYLLMGRVVGIEEITVAFRPFSRILSTVGRGLPGTPALHNIVVRLPELQETQSLGTLNIRHHQATGTVRAGQVNRQTKVHMPVVNSNRLALFIMPVRDVHRRHSSQRTNYGVTNNMREGNLAATGTRQILIDRSTVLNQQLCRDCAHGGRGGDGKGILHIGSHSFCRATEGNDLIFYFFHVFRLW